MADGPGWFPHDAWLAPNIGPYRLVEPTGGLEVAAWMAGVVMMGVGMAKFCGNLRAGGGRLDARCWIAVGLFFTGALVLCAAPVLAQEGADPPPREEALPPGDAGSGSLGPDVWADRALEDEAAAAEGRAALPFTQEQIEALGLLLRQTQRASEAAKGPRPEGRVRRLRLAGTGAEIPAIALRRGYGTVVAILDATGAPWPVEEVLVESRFLPEGSAGGSTGGSAGDGGQGGAHLVWLSPRARYLDGNALIKLEGLAEPLALRLAEGDGPVDFRVELRLALAGPNAGPLAPLRPAGFHAGDSALLGLLGGEIPAGAERLEVTGGGPADRAWRLGGDVVLVTRLELLSPGPWAAERGGDGRWAYRLPETPHALVSEAGRTARMSFRRRQAEDGS